MRPINFNYDRKQYDQLGCFHTHSGAFTEFETGEVICSNPTPDNRGRMTAYGLEVSATDSYSMSPTARPDYYLDKDCTELVKPAWLNDNGMQHMVIDYEQKVAVNLYGSHTGYGNSYCPSVPKAKELPHQFRFAQAFWPRAGVMPQPLTQFRVSKPDKTTRKSLGGLLKEVRAIVAAAVRVNPKEYEVYGYGTLGYLADSKWVGMTSQEVVQKLSDLVSPEYNPNRYRNEAFQTIANNGFTFPRAISKHDFLYFK